MNLIANVALLGFVPIALAIAALVRGPMGIAAVIVGGWLFLPSGRGFNLPGLPPYNKPMAITLAALLATMIFRPGDLLSLRPRWFDIPAVAWCITPLFSSLTNGLGLYDGASEVYGQVMLWGIPYLIGRTVFRSPGAAKSFVIAIFVGGLVYVPLCLWESRMSPQLHLQVFGYRPSKFTMVYRLGGYRPIVFTRHGLELGMFMTMASVAGVWIWFSGLRRRVMGMRARWAAIGLYLVTLWCRSMSGIALLLMGSTAQWMTRARPAAKWILVAMAALPFAYMSVRIPGVWEGEPLLTIVEAIDAQRAVSFQARFDGEDAVLENARRKLLLGWGGHGGGRASQQDDDLVPVDGLWVIYLGKYGLLGVVSFFMAQQLPTLLFLWRSPGRMLLRHTMAPAAAMATILVLVGLNSLLNAFPSTIDAVGAGLVGSALSMRRTVWSKSPSRANGPGPASSGTRSMAGIKPA